MINDAKPADESIKNFSFFPDSIYKWIKTENAGLQEKVVRVKNGFVEFHSGRKCSLGALQDMMDPISEGKDNSAELAKARAELTRGLAIEEPLAKSPEQMPGLKNEYSDSFDDMPQPVAKPAVQPKAVQMPPVEQKIEVKEEPKSPVRLVLESNKSTEKMRVFLEINIDVPEKPIFDLLNKSFPDSDLLKEVTEMILSDLDGDGTLTNLKQLIKDNLERRFNDQEEDT